MSSTPSSGPPPRRDDRPSGPRRDDGPGGGDRRGGRGDDRRGGGGRGRGGPRGRFRRRRVCTFCVEKIDMIDYKNISRLRGFVSERGKIDPRRKTGCCARHQRKLATAVKRARKMALLPYTIHHVQESGIYELRG